VRRHLSYIPTPDEIRILRKRAGLTQRELARRAGVSQSLIARIEGGSVDPRLSTLKRILKVIEEALEEKSHARHIMHSPVITLSVSDPLEKAAKLMWKHNISQIPVVDNEGRVIGTIYEDTIVKKLLTYKDADKVFKMPAGEIAEAPLPAVSPDEPVEKVVRILLSGVPAVLVVDNRRPIGIITKSDIIAVHLHRTSA